MRGPLDLSRELLEAEVLHEFVHLRRRIDDAAELPDVLDQSPESCVVVQLYEADSGIVAAFVPAQSVVATSALAGAVGARTIVAMRPATISEATDFHPSLVAPFGLPAHVLTVADESLATQEVVFTATGDGSTALKIRAADLLALTKATVAPLVEPGGLYDLTRETTATTPGR